uniref:DUF1801 domain-containing protein n=1 Tax=Roseihalotalea indica TaxID=2867963 RepID=A0AA49JFN0_9BACT|nr:DUF1801 domain-containing protein [Tunicatimonas sp. TK19036]
MESSITKASTVDEYISMFPEDIQLKLQQLRQTVRETVPEAEEVISYAMPTYKLHGNLVHFAAFKKHIGFYPAPSGITAFQDELAPYRRAKGSVQFPLSEPLPLKLIQKIVKHRVKENLAKTKKK